MSLKRMRTGTLKLSITQENGSGQTFLIAMTAMINPADRSMNRIEGTTSNVRKILCVIQKCALRKRFGNQITTPDKLGGELIIAEMLTFEGCRKLELRNDS